MSTQGIKWSATYTTVQYNMNIHTIAEDGEPQERQVALSLYRVPAQVWVTLGNQHGTTLKTTSCQVCHHLHTHTNSPALPLSNITALCLFDSQCQQQ